jgi:hypothetical protein
MALKFGRFGKEIRGTWRVLKCGAGEGWKRSVGLIVGRRTQHYKDSRRKEVSYKQYIEGRLTVLVKSCVGTAF